MFNAPVPGQSLTLEPKSMPYERPPELTNPKDILSYHMERLQDEEVLDAIFTFMDYGIDIKTLTQGIVRGAVAKGIHTIDASLMVAPAIHEFIRVSAKAAGVEYDEGFIDPEDEKEKEAFKREAIHERFKRENPVLQEIEEEATVPDNEIDDTEVDQLEAEDQPAPKGLMERM